MIRLRNPSGETLETDNKWTFVELCDTRGDPVFVLFKDGPVYKLFSKKDPEAARYSKLFGVRFVEHKPLEI